MAIHEIAKLFAVLGTKLDPSAMKTLTAFEGRLKSVEGRLKSVSSASTKTSKDIAKSLTTHAKALDKLSSSTKEKAAADRSAAKATTAAITAERKMTKAVNTTTAALRRKNKEQGVTVKATPTKLTNEKVVQSTRSAVKATGKVSTNLRSDVFQNLFGGQKSTGNYNARAKMYQGLFGATTPTSSRSPSGSVGWNKRSDAFTSLFGGGRPSVSTTKKQYEQLFNAVASSPFQKWAERTKTLEGSGAAAKLARQQSVAKLEASNLKTKERTLRQEKASVREQQRADDRKLKVARDVERHEMAMRNAKARLANTELRNQILASRAKFTPGIATGNPNAWYGGFIGATAGAAASGFGMANLWEADRQIISGRMSLEGILGESQGLATFDWLKQQGDVLGFDWKEALPEFQRFMGAAYPAAGLDQSQDVFQAFSELGTVRKMQPIQRKMMYKAIGDMYGKRDISMEELRNQLSDSGFSDAFSVFEAAWRAMDPKNNTGSFEKAVSDPNKQIDPVKLMPFVIAEIKKKTATPLEKAKQSSVSWQGRLANRFSNFQEAFFNSGGDESFKNLWKELYQDLDKIFPKAEKLAKIFNVLLAPIKALSGAIAEFSANILPKWSERLGIGEEKLIGFGMVAASLLSPWTRWLGILSLASIAIEDIIYSVQGKGGVLLKWLGSPEKVQSVVGWVGGILVAIKGIQLAIAGWKFGANVASAISEAFITGGTYLLNIAKETGKWIGLNAGKFMWAGAAIAAGLIGYEIGTYIYESFLKGWEPFERMMDSIFSKIDALIEAIKHPFTKGPNQRTDEQVTEQFNRGAEAADQMNLFQSDPSVTTPRQPFEGQDATEYFKSEQWNNLQRSLQTPTQSPQSSLIPPNIDVGDININVQGNLDSGSAEAVKQTMKEAVRETVADIISVARLQYANV